MTQDKSRKTEKPTPNKLREAKKKGQVSKSRELVSTTILLTSSIYFWFTWDWTLEKLTSLFSLPAPHIGTDLTLALPNGLFIELVSIVLWVSLPLLIILFLAIVVIHILQFGWVFSFHPILPEASKVNPAEGLKRIFSLRSLIETLFSLAKVLIISLILFFIVKDSIGVLIHDKSVCQVDCLRDIFEDLIFKLIVFLLPAVILLSIFDLIYQKYEYLKEQKMTREELKRDLKNTEGDPLLAGYRKQISRGYLGEEIQDRIRRSRILIVDLDISIAIHYERGVTPLPVILAMGNDKAAKQMVAIAQEQAVPIIVNSRLAHQLLDEGVIDQHIPESTLDSVASALRKAAAENRL